MIATARRMGKPIPPPWDNPPELGPGAGIFMTAFNELNAERPYHPEYITRINVRQIRQWSTDNGFAGDVDFVQELIAHITVMDNAFIPLEVERRKREAKRAKGPVNGKPPPPERIQRPIAKGRG